MKRTLLIVLLLGLLTPLPARSGFRARAQTTARTMAVTFDDLPYVKMGEGPYVTRAQAATEKILNTLKKHKVPAVGFVNEHKLEVAGRA